MVVVLGRLEPIIVDVFRGSHGFKPPMNYFTVKKPNLCENRNKFNVNNKKEHSPRQCSGGTHTRDCQGKCTGRNSSALVVKSDKNKTIYQDILTALACATNDLSVPCHKQQTGAATAPAVFWIRPRISPPCYKSSNLISYHQNISEKSFLLLGPGLGALLSSYLEGALYKFHR